MRVFVTGASGHIGSAVVPELVQAGHEVVGLARSETSAEAVKALGADVRRGDLDDLDGLREAARDADAVIHLGFNHEAMRSGDFAGAATADLAVIRAFGDALAGTGKALVGIGSGPTGDEERDKMFAANPRSEAWRTILSLTDRDVRSMLVAVPQVTHSSRDRTGFIPMLIGVARGTGVSGYVGDGANRWPAVHTLDLGRLFRLAVEKAPAGAQVQAAAEEGIAVREIAEVVGRHLGIPTESIPAGQVADHFQAFAPFITLDNPSPSEETQRSLGWRPVRPGLIADLEEGHYFKAE